MLYIDQPIGTGFSVAGNDSIPGTLEQSTQQLYACLQQFFKQHAELQARPFLITGEVRRQAAAGCQKTPTCTYVDRTHVLHLLHHPHHRRGAQQAGQQKLPMPVRTC